MTKLNLNELNELTNNELEMFLTNYNTVYVVRTGSDYEAFTSNCVSVDSDEEFIAEVSVAEYFDSKADWEKAFIKHNPNSSPSNYMPVGWTKEAV